MKVVVVGSGNAGLCAALSAAEAGASVTVVESAPRADRGGNSVYTAGAMRVSYRGIDDLRLLVPDLDSPTYPPADFGAYPSDQFMDDLGRVTGYRCDPELAEILVHESLPTLRWLRAHGVRFAPMYARQAFKSDGRFRFWGGLTVETVGGGQGLIEALFAEAERLGVRVMYQHRAVALCLEDGEVGGTVLEHEGHRVSIPADAVVLASGGFEANPQWRAQYLGPNWDLAKTRGTRFNVGDGIRMALDAGAAPWGNWSGCHAVCWDQNAPDFGTRTVGDGYQKHSYPLGILVNAEGQRFVDEGADFRNYTYAAYGRAVLAQPGHFAWQIFDAKVLALLRDEYHIREVTRVRASTLAELAGKLEGVNGTQVQETIAGFNEAVDEAIPFDPSVKDGRGTVGLRVPKSNWANRIDTPPFEAYAVTCGITFTFGGLHIDNRAQTLDLMASPVPGLYACGELVGGIFYSNYPGGSGLTAGAVFGRIAGREAASNREGRGGSSAAELRSAPDAQ